MKNQKGFVQIPILVAIIVSILILGSVGYFGVKQYRSLQKEKVDAESQQKALETAQQEIGKLKKEGEEIKKKQNLLEQQVKTQTEQPQTGLSGFSITSVEISPYLTEIPVIICHDADLNITLGSGSIWNLPGFDSSIVITNKHVVEEQNCVADTYNGDNPLSTYNIFLRDASRWNDATDISVFPLFKNDVKQILNSSISQLSLCLTEMAVGSPVVVIGFPAFGIRMVDLYNQGFLQRVATQIVTNGIISGYDTTVVKPKGRLPYPNYFVSAKIDSGNSGGIAFSKDERGLCVLGVPTWLTVGNFETQGLIQNIHNVKYRQ